MTFCHSILSSSERNEDYKYKACVVNGLTDMVRKYPDSPGLSSHTTRRFEPSPAWAQVFQIIQNLTMALLNQSTQEKWGNMHYNNTLNHFPAKSFLAIQYCTIDEKVTMLDRCALLFKNSDSLHGAKDSGKRNTSQDDFIQCIILTS